VQVPAARKVATFALTPQTEDVRELNITGLPDAPPVALTLYVVPINAGDGAVEVKAID
jgi:hypothetical protein